MTRVARFRSRLADAWNSPVVMSWGSMGVRLAAVVVVWPLALRLFDATEIVLWQVFSTLMALQMVADFGLTSVLSRLAAARKAAFPGEVVRAGDDERERLRRLARVGEFFYTRLLLAGALLLVPVTWVVSRHINQLQGASFVLSWLAWAAAAAAFLLALRTIGWSALLQGAGQLVRVRRIEMMTGGCGLVATAAGLLTLGGLLPVGVIMLAVAGVQAWLWRSLLKKEMGAPAKDAGDEWKALIPVVWRGAWRSGVGVCCTAGVAQAAALTVAARAGTAEAAAYLIGWRLISVISQFSQAPFYGRLPEFGELAAARKREVLLTRVRDAMAWSLGLFVVGCIVTGFAGPWALRWAGANVAWPEPALWSVMGLALFFERYGAMHLQLDTLGHDVRWHITGAGSGLIAVGLMLGLSGTLGVLAVPLGMLGGQLLFYCPYAVCLSKRRYGWTWRAFDWPATAWLGLLLAGLGGLMLTALFVRV